MYYIFQKLSVNVTRMDVECGDDEVKIYERNSLLYSLCENVTTPLWFYSHGNNVTITFQSDDFWVQRGFEITWDTIGKGSSYAMFV